LHTQPFINMKIIYFEFKKRRCPGGFVTSKNCYEIKVVHTHLSNNPFSLPVSSISDIISNFLIDSFIFLSLSLNVRRYWRINNVQFNCKDYTIYQPHCRDDFWTEYDVMRFFMICVIHHNRNVIITSNLDIKYVIDYIKRYFL